MVDALLDTIDVTGCIPIGINALGIMSRVAVMM